MHKNCSAVVILNQLGITWYAGASVGVLVVCLPLIAEQNAYQIFLTQHCWHIVKVLRHDGTEMQFEQAVHLLPYSIGPISKQNNLLQKKILKS